MQWITCSWPGLSRLWLQGQWAGLAVAAGFGVIFNLAVVMQLKLSGQVPETVQQSVWLLAAIFWVGGCFEGILTTRDFRRQQQLQLKRNSSVVDTTTIDSLEQPALEEINDRPKDDDSTVSGQEICRESEQSVGDDLFIQARNQYLKGSWIECESLIDSALEEYPGDLETRLLQISLLRMTKRFEEALVEITQFQRWDGAEKWSFEITREVELLERILSNREDSEITHAA